MLTGRVIRAQNSFFYVQTAQGIIPCKLRGRFRKRLPVYPGDRLEIRLLPEGSGVVERLLPRENLLRRPAVANVDRVVLTFAAAQPDIHPLLLNRFLVLAEASGIPGIFICINKMDLCPTDRQQLLALYEGIGYPVLRVSAEREQGMERLRGLLTGGTTVFAGPSGVGKSSLLNRLVPSLGLATGEVSGKIKRGRHTTKLAQLIPYGQGCIVDTPGFGSIGMEGIGAGELPGCFREFAPYSGGCRFSTCTHSHEPQCAVKAAVDAGRISRERYEAYLSLLDEIEKRKKEFP